MGTSSLSASRKQHENHVSGDRASKTVFGLRGREGQLMQPAAQGQAWTGSSALSYPEDNTQKRKVLEKGSSPNPGSTVLAVSSITARYEELNQAPQGLNFLQP